MELSADRAFGVSAAPLRCLRRTCVIDQDATHGLCRDAVEVTPAPPLHVPLINQLEVGLVDEGRCRERSVRVFAA